MPLITGFTSVLRLFRRTAIIAAVMFAAAAHSSLYAEQTGDKAESTATVSTLAEQLEALRESSYAQAPPEMMAIGQRQLEALKQSRIVETALQVGDKAPRFELPDAHGATVSSSTLLAKGPLIVVFYRGAWCPFCNLTLSALQQSLPAFEAEGASLVAISAEKPELELETVNQHELQFAVLSDHELKTAKAFGIAYEMTAELDSLMRGFGLQLAERHASANAELPLGATYIIDKQGIIQYAFLDIDYTKRAEPSEILAVLQQLKD